MQQTSGASHATVLFAHGSLPQPLPTFSLTLRSADGQSERLTKSVADALAALDPTLILSFRSLADQIDPAFRQEQLLAALSVFFGALALVLATLGLYGVTSYRVGRRRFQIGVRVALGASRASVMRLVIRRVAVLVAFGVGLGALFSALVTRFIATLLFEVSARDISTFIIAAAVSDPCERAGRLATRFAGCDGRCR